MKCATPDCKETTLGKYCQACFLIQKDIISARREEGVKMILLLKMEYNACKESGFSTEYLKGLENAISTLDDIYNPKK